MGNAESLSFEQAYHKLEEIVRRLEEGDLSLDDSIALYEEGVKLAQFCEKLLEEAELRIRKLQPDGEGGYALTPFEPERGYE
ncbi:MAG: exodeoxyribonuclease VII small subunit [Chloroflexi bacterium]|nr:MAG: exodeoxyribonuclease VII small subunit [Chloroflexota bacterium]HDN79907.1 exodeoxyribonuclease VII small subunit [Chloroflexota bacterium]